MTDLWTYRTEIAVSELDLAGYDVEAKDGHIGTVDEHDWEAGASYLVVDTGFWIFGKRRVIPAGVVMSVDHTARVVTINMVKDDVKNAPDWDDTWKEDHTSRGVMNDYFDVYRW